MSRIRLRDSSSAIRAHDDGTVELIVWRRIERSMGGWNELTFRGPSLPAVEAAYDEYCQESAAKSVRQSERRARWGPLGTGTMK